MELIKIPAHPSNRSSRGGVKPRMIVLHYTAGGGDGAISWFQNPKANASAHYVVKRDGLVVEMADVIHSCWHAGQRGKRGSEIKPNRSSIGIEIANWGEVHLIGGRYLTWIYFDKSISGSGPAIPKNEVIEIGGRYWHIYPDVQVEAVFQLVERLCNDNDIPYQFMFKGQEGFTRAGITYDKVPYYLPSGRMNSRLAISRFRDTAGICCHCHISQGKDDPGPAFPFEDMFGEQAAARS